ncbi:MAG: hypothetical protein ACFB9N_17120 [Geitlerinemataceae cyanobacterium]
MILERRQTHYFAAIAMAIVLPLLFAASLIWRPNYAMTSGAADELFARAGYVTETAESIASERIKLGVYTFTADAVQVSLSETAIELTSVFNLRIPDPLLYWAPGKDAPEALGDDAILLGGLSGRSRRRFVLPDEAKSGGQLVLFSQGSSTVIGAGPLPDSLKP